MQKLFRRVLLIGWDGAGWRLIDPLLEKGQTPSLEEFINGGVMGNVASLTPMLSPILWTSIATGKHGDEHEIWASPNRTKVVAESVRLPAHPARARPFGTSCRSGAFVRRW